MKPADYLNTANTSALGFGAMRLPDDAETTKMVDAYLASGYNYIDTAYIYGGSEERLNRTLVKRHPRDSYVIANKMPPWEVQNFPEDCEKILKEQMRRTGLDHFDYYLIHSLDDNREKELEKRGFFQWGAELKKRGIISHLGFSFHGGAGFLRRLLEKYKEVEFVQLQQNYMDNLRGPASDWHALAVKHNLPIIVMEPVKGGSLAKLPAPAEKLFKEYAPDRSIASWAMQYAATLQNVTCVLGGMTCISDMHDNIKTFKDLKPLSPEEKNLLDQVLAEMSKVANIPCTACKYCHDSCPLNIDIASSFSLYNEVKRGSTEWNSTAVYKGIPEGCRADACIKCGACVPLCPQHIDIPNALTSVAKLFG